MRGAAVVASVVVAVSACGSSGGEGDGGSNKITMGVFTNSPVSAISQTIIKQGYLEDEGFDVDVLSIASGPELVASLLSGDSTVATGAPSAIFPLMDQGECLKYIAPEVGNMYNIRANKGVLSDPSAPTQDRIKQLKGKRIGIVARGAATEVWTAAILKDAGLDPAKDVTWVAVGAGATALQALEAKSVDAVLSYPPLEQNLAKNGIETDLVAESAKGDPDSLEQLIQAGLVVTCDYEKDNPDAIKALCSASKKAFAYVRDPANKEALGSFYASILDVDEEAGAQIRDQLDSAYENDTFTAENWKAQAAFVPEGTKVPDIKKSVVDCG